MNRKQLEESIRYVYGSGIDAYSYLQKFIDYELQFPKPVFNYGSKHYKDYSKVLFGAGDPGRTEFFSTCAERLDCSLREMQQIFIKFCLWHKGTKSEYASYLVLIMLFLANKK